MAPQSCRRLAIGMFAGAFFFAAAGPARSAASAEEQSVLAASAASAKRRAERGDHQLLYIYRDATAYRKLKAADLDVVRGHLHQAGLRLSELLVKRKALDQQAEFHNGKPLPADLQEQVDESDASLTASAYVFRGLEQDIALIVAKYERPRARLEKLWAGAPLGSMGLYDPGAPASSAR
ncbi:MAG: hypothetical protein ABIQ33_12450 [Caldimonas sp.]